jgi:hypothetical protein
MKAIIAVSAASFLLASITEALRPIGVTKKSPSLFVQLTNKADGDLYVVARAPGRRDFLSTFSYFVAVPVGGICLDFPSSAGAVNSASSSTGGTFTLLAEEIKTLDLSLPSYDAINTLKSSAETEKALGVENPPDAPSKELVAPRKKKSSSVGGSGGGASGNGNPLSNVLPSMNKSVGKKPRSSTTASERPTSATRVQLEEAEDEVKTMDLSLPSYLEGTQSKERNIFAL